MVNWLFLLAVGGLVSPVVAGVDCIYALSSWTFDDFKNCENDRILLDGGNGNIDLSKWTDDQLIEVFGEKVFYGGLKISNSQITGKGVYFTMGSTKEKALIIIENNHNLEELVIEKESKSPLYVRVSGNRLLKQKFITMLHDLKANQEVRDDSYIQVYHECKLNEIAVKDVKSELANCKAVYGDLIFDPTTVFPQDENDWKSIKPLEYVEGCLRITGTNLASWYNITFLQETIGLKGCTAGHEISGNQNMCIQPPLAQGLRKSFDNMTISGNQNCTPECTSGFVHNTVDKTCVIITDSLVISDKTTDEVLEALANVEEIRGNLQLTNTKLTNFNYLPKLQKLNTDKIDSGGVISLKFNRQLKSFDLPSLNASGFFVGGLVKYETDENDKLTIDPSFFQRLGVKDSDKFVVTRATTTEGTTTTPLTTVPYVKSIDARDFLETHGPFVIPTAVVVGIIAIAVLIIGSNFINCWHLPKKWEWHSMGGEIDQTEIYKYDKESDWHKKAKQLIEESKPKVEKGNLEHKNNTTFKDFTFYNHNARRVMPGLFQLADYEAKVKMGKDIKAFKTDTIDYPAGEGGVYGLAFQDKIGNANKKIYRTQCDRYGYTWFNYKLPPIYPEYFEKTAKLMAKLPCDMIGEKIRYMKDQGIPIGEYGIIGQEFHAVVTMDENDPVPSRAKKGNNGVFWLGRPIPQFQVHHYREQLNNLKINGKKFYWLGYKNLDKFICRLMQALMNLPARETLELTVPEVHHFLKVLQPDLFGGAAYKEKYPRARMSAGEYVTPLNKTHVRIVGEIRGDFDALRRAINIPSLLGGTEHPLLQYNWVFLGNYTGRHPQSLETLMFLLALQFLYGRECIVLLRGIMEFDNTGEIFGFKDNLIDRFGPKDGPKVWGWMMKAMSKMPFNCRILKTVYCSSGGFTEADVPEKSKKGVTGKDNNAAPSEYHESATRQELDKLFSLPNVTVRDYLENADTGAGYYYGERVLQKIAKETDMYTFFSTMPMTSGVGFFSDSSAAQLITISSVRHLHGHGGQKTLLAAVAEIDGETNVLTIHTILHEDEMVDQKTGELWDEHGNEKKGASSIATQVSKEGTGTMSKSRAGASVESADKNMEEKKSASKTPTDSKQKTQ